MPQAEEWDPALSDALLQLSALDDEALQRAARSPLPAQIVEQMEALHFKRQREGLTRDEEETVRSLLAQYERARFVRAQATALLQQRGLDVAG